MSYIKIKQECKRNALQIQFTCAICTAANLPCPPLNLGCLTQNPPHDLVEDTTCAPHVHLEAVVAVSQEALWSSVPARGDVLRVRRLGIHTPARTKVAKFQTVMLHCK